jgi:hypothetical protein
MMCCWKLLVKKKGFSTSVCVDWYNILLSLMFLMVCRTMGWVTILEKLKLDIGDMFQKNRGFHMGSTIGKIAFVLFIWGWFSRVFIFWILGRALLGALVCKYVFFTSLTIGKSESICKRNEGQ